MIQSSSVDQILESEVQLSFARSGGPGGQNVNKVASKVVLKWDLLNSAAISEAWKGRFRERFASQITKDGTLVLSCEEQRSQLQNRVTVLEKLATMLHATAKPPKKRVATKATASSKRKRLDEKKKHSEKKSTRRKINDT